ncbi:MAG: RNA 2',3'-cyclic phosphodiesterase [Actinomycetota bacterium]|nr:RNA 2',3'-cyclic phosphodiesterase [Actinomycetota bacterium]
MNKIRLFVAVDIPGEIRDVLGDLIEDNKKTAEGARWVRPENLHLTLKFIGNQDENRLERLRSEVRTAAERSRAFTVLLGGCGAFPSPYKARVIWVGMESGIEEARNVAGKLDSRLAKAGVEHEKRQFRGHLTLARLKRPSNCSSLLEDMADGLRDLSHMPFRVDEIVLYRSTLGSEGSTYTVLERMVLGDNRHDTG